MRSVNLHPEYPEYDSGNENHFVTVVFEVWADNEENARAKLWWDLRGNPHDYEVKGGEHALQG